MRLFFLAIVLLMMQGCCLLRQQETLPSPQQQTIQTSLSIECIVPPEIPKQGSSYRDLEEWGITTLKIWANCARDKKALVDSWPK